MGGGGTRGGGGGGGERRARACGEEGVGFAGSGRDAEGLSGGQKIVEPVGQIRHQAVSRHHQMAGRKHHPVGQARAARRVQDGGQVAVDDPRPGTAWRVQEFRPGDARQAARPSILGRRAGRSVDQHHGLQGCHHGGGLRGHLVGQGLPTRRRGHQHPCPGVAQDVQHLWRLECGVDRHQHASSGRGREGSHHRFGPLVQVHGHPVAALQAQALKTRLDAVYRLGQFAVVQPWVRRCGLHQSQARLFGTAVTQDQVVQARRWRCRHPAHGKSMSC